jgi:hypothetical protein
MSKVLAIPPKNKFYLTPPQELAKKLTILIGHTFTLTGKTRTDGSNARKLVATTLESTKLPEACLPGEYTIIPPKRKGVPKILREYVDTYIVTSGNYYNLQVWNRNPASESVQIEYSSGDTLSARDVRFIFLRIDVKHNQVRSIIILTPEYIEEHFGKFGKPTIKHQLIISTKARQNIINSKPPILFYSDTPRILDLISDFFILPDKSMHDLPTQGAILPLEIIKDRVIENLLGSIITPASTKARGQMLELMVAQVLGYTPASSDLLAGRYPDIRNQILEVKVQDSPTIDLGMYSPQFEEILPFFANITTLDVRYVIALMNPETNKIEGFILCPGKYLGEHFSYISDTNYKCQRSIPMDFFDHYDGEAVFNP